MPWALAQRVYMRINIPAQSQDSVPPAPELISMKASLPSASPLSRASSSARPARSLMALSWARASSREASSPSSSAISA